jgi:hypothetical protein
MGTRLFRSIGTTRGVRSRDRASWRRLQRIRMRDEWSITMWILLVGLIVLAFLTPRLSRLHEEFHHPHHTQSR